MAQINVIAVFLVVLALLGVLSHNNTLTISATLLLLIQQTALAQYLPLLEKHGISVGIIVLTMGVLAPLVSGKIALPSWQQWLNWNVFASILMGIFVAWVASRGVGVMSGQPLLMVGLILGTMIGVAFLGGIPVGPLIAAGLLSFFVDKMP